MAAALDPGAVAQLLAEPATRRATLEELEACAQPIPSATALASAAGLVSFIRTLAFFAAAAEARNLMVVQRSLATNSRRR